MTTAATIKSYHLLPVHSMRGSVLSGWLAFVLINPHKALQGSYYHHTHFTDEETMT